MSGVIYFNCISTLPAHIRGSSWVIFPDGQWTCVMPFKQNRKLKYVFFIYILRDKKRFVLKTFSRLKSINLFYLRTSSEDEITELHGWTETSQIPQKQESGYFHGWGWNGTLSTASCPAPPPQGHRFCVALGTSLADWDGDVAWATAQETCCKGQQDHLVVSSWTLGPDLCSIPAQAARHSLGSLAEASLSLLNRSF